MNMTLRRVTQEASGSTYIYIYIYIYFHEIRDSQTSLACHGGILTNCVSCNFLPNSRRKWMLFCRRTALDADYLRN